MINGNFIATVFAIALSVFAICSFNKQTTKKENFILGSSLTVSNEKVEYNPATGSVQSVHPGGDYPVHFHMTPSSLQSSPPPRFSNVPYGSTIKYKYPNIEHLAVPKEPLYYGNMAIGNEERESYHYNEKDSLSEYKENYQEVKDTMPVQDMTSILSDESSNPIMMDRLMVSTSKSRLYGNGCHVRGDPPIAPCHQHHGWFHVSAKPHRDLMAGAMHILGGVDNDTAKLTAALIHESSGNTKTTIGGFDFESGGQFKNVNHVSHFK